MNSSRIEEFVADASTYALNADPDNFENILRIRLAELIIKECIAVANYHSDGHVPDQFGRKMFHYNADIGKQISEYFGVEE
jgi:hypothetical protein